jgi:hypothetical protein
MQSPPPSGFTLSEKHTSFVVPSDLIFKYTLRETSLRVRYESSNASKSEQFSAHFALPQRAQLCAQPTILPKEPLLRVEEKSVLKVALVNTHFKFWSTTIIAAGTPSIIRL